MINETFTDINNDGILDLIFWNSHENNIHIFYGAIIHNNDFVA